MLRVSEAAALHVADLEAVGGTARYFSDNIGSLADDLSNQELGRFKQAFVALNALL